MTIVGVLKRVGEKAIEIAEAGGQQDLRAELHSMMEVIDSIEISGAALLAAAAEIEALEALLVKLLDLDVIDLATDPDSIRLQAGSCGCCSYEARDLLEPGQLDRLVMLEDGA